jgi:hypothetical protein
MTKQKLYQFISDVVICFYSKNIKMSFASLNSLLMDRNSALSNNKELAKVVAIAYKYWEKRDPVVYHAIAYVFSDKNGKRTW